MNWKDIATTIAKVAPGLGTIIGGPVGAIAGSGISLIARALGAEETPDAVMQAISADPQAMAKIREVELNNEVKIQRMVYQTIQTAESGWTDRFKSMNKADGQSTRPKIALMMAWMLAIPYVLIGCAITYAVVTEMVMIEEMWPTLLAYLSVPLGLLRAYFGDLRREHAQGQGQQVDFGLLGGMFGGRKN